MKGRNFQEVSDKIIKIIDEKCDFSEEQVADIIEEIHKIQESSRYKAPETQYMVWWDLAEVLNYNFDPLTSDWEAEIGIIFNDYKGSVNDFRRTLAER